MDNEVPKNGSIKYYYQNGRFYQFSIKAKVQVVHLKIKTASRIDKLSAIYRKIDGQQT